MWTYETRESVLNRRELFALEFGKALLSRDGVPKHKCDFADDLFKLVEEVLGTLDATDPNNEDEE